MMLTVNYQSNTSGLWLGKRVEILRPGCYWNTIQKNVDKANQTTYRCYIYHLHCYIDLRYHHIVIFLIFFCFDIILG
jgi:hypothetical protein